MKNPNLKNVKQAIYHDLLDRDWEKCKDNGVLELKRDDRKMRIEGSETFVIAYELQPEEG